MLESAIAEPPIVSKNRIVEVTAKISVTKTYQNVTETVIDHQIGKTYQK